MTSQVYSQSYEPIIKPGVKWKIRFNVNDNLSKVWIHGNMNPILIDGTEYFGVGAACREDSGRLFAHVSTLSDPPSMVNFSHRLT